MNWRDLVKTVAPALGTALGGPVAGMAVKHIADKVLGNPDATEDELEAWVTTASPAQMLELKKADQSFQVEMRKLKIDVFKLEVEDRASARTLAATNMTPHITLSAIYTCGYFWLLWALVTGTVVIAEGTEQLVVTVVGVLTAAQIQIMNFWFGSSSGSKDKTTQIQTRAGA